MNVNGGICIGSVLFSGPLFRSGIALEFLFENPNVTSSESSPIFRSEKSRILEKYLFSPIVHLLPILLGVRNEIYDYSTYQSNN